MNPTAYLRGNVRMPEAWLFFDRTATHAATGRPLIDWVKAAPSRRWNGDAGCWVVTAFGRKDPDALLMRAGFRRIFDEDPPGHGPLDPSLHDVIGFADLVNPLAKQSNVNPGIALVRPRFAGWEVTRDLLGPACTWDKEQGRFEVPLVEILQHGDVKQGLSTDPATIDAARALLLRKPTFGHSVHSDETVLADAAAAAFSTGLGETPGLERLIDVVGDVPDWFGMDLFPYQRVGALAVAAGRGFLADPTGLGKGSPRWVRILTPTGWTTYGDVAVGDQVIGSDGRPTTVTGVFPRGALPVHRVRFNDGSSVVVDGDHLWTFERSGRTLTASTRDIAADLADRPGLPRPRIPVVAPVAFSGLGAPRTRKTTIPGACPVHGYLLGVLLARGAVHPTGVRIAPFDEAVKDRFAAALPDRAVLVPDEKNPTANRKRPRYRVVAAQAHHNSFARECRSLGLSGVRRSERRIPETYLWAPLTIRRDLMTGLMDAGGRMTRRGVVEFETVSPGFADDLLFLARSLGYVATRTQYAQPGGALPNGTVVAQHDRIRISLSPPTGTNAYSAEDPRNADLREQARRTIVAIEDAGVEDVVCISVAAADSLYVTEDFLVTHNTAQAIAALAIRDVDRAVIVVPPVTVTHWAREIERCGLATPPPPPVKAAKTPRRRGKKSDAASDGAVEATEVALSEDLTTSVSPPVSRSGRQAPPSRLAGPVPEEESRASDHDTAIVTPVQDFSPFGSAESSTGVVRGAPGAEASAATTPARHLVVFRAGRKEPDLPERGIVIVPDSLLASRPMLRRRLIAWEPDGFAYDEVHRARTWKSARASAAREITDSLGPQALRVAATATPLFSNPSDLASPLAISGHLDPVFGGYSAFIERYCKRNQFNALVPNLQTLPELRKILAERVWVRRNKAEVLADLPKVFSATQVVDVDLAGFKAAHNEVIDKIMLWLDERLATDGDYPTEEMVEAYSRSQIGLMSPLRKAAGLAKVPVATDIISDWIADEVLVNADGSFSCDRPLLIWVHHKEVVDALVAHARQHLKDADKRLVGVIDGSTNTARRGQLVDLFQAGQLPVLICSITAAGVGITLTRGSDQFFVESDYSQPNVSQAIDRQNRIGQTRSVSVTTLLAEGTLDTRIQQILSRKGRTIEAVLGDRQGVVDTDLAHLDEAVGPAEIISGLVEVAINRHRKAPRKVA